MQSQITESRRFKVDGYTVTFAAGVKNSHAVVVFGIMTGLEAVPVFTLEKNWRNLEEAESYVRKVTIIAAEKLLAHYQENYRTMVALSLAPLPALLHRILMQVDILQGGVGENLLPISKLLPVFLSRIIREAVSSIS